MIIMYTGPNYVKMIDAGFYINIIDSDTGTSIYSNIYAYGQDASFSKKYAKEAHEMVKASKKHNWNTYYNEKPFVIDLLLQYVKEYKVQQIICKDGEHVTNSNDLMVFINDFILSDKKLSKLANMSNSSIDVNFKKLNQLNLIIYTDRDNSNRVRFNVNFKRDNDDPEKFGHLYVSIYPNLDKLSINIKISYDEFKYSVQSLEYTESALHSQLDEFYDQFNQTFNSIKDGFKILLEFLDLYSHKFHLDIINYEDIKQMPEYFK